MSEQENSWIPEWFKKFYAATPGGRAQEVRTPGSVPYSPVGQPKPTAFGISRLGSTSAGIQDWTNRQLLNASDVLGRFFSSRPGAAYGEGLGDLAYSTTPRRTGGTNLPGTQYGMAPGKEQPWTGQMDFPQQGSAYYRPGAEEEYRAQTKALVDQKRAEEEAALAAQQTPTDWLAQANALLGGGPDYNAYRAALTDQTAELNARIQAMYNQLAEQAGANQERIAGVYDTAQSGVGNVYDSATQNVADAYSSSQQQAADQLARLGIEAAAPAVINPAALSQAQAVSGLEQGRAGGLSALDRYGSTAQGFASQMGQVAQQQGTEFNAALLNSLQRQLAESLAMEAQGAYDARLRAPGLANELYQASQIGQPQGLTPEQQLAYERFAWEQGQGGADVVLRQQQAQRDRYSQLFEFYQGDAQKANDQLQYEITNGLI